MHHIDPVPCIVCETQLDTAFDPSQNQPYKGTVFMTQGHYGSTFFDPMNGSCLEIVVCDECCKKAMEKKQILHRIYQHGFSKDTEIYTIYNGEHP